MQITSFGWIFIPLAVAVALRARPWLPGLLLGSSVFQAAAVVNIPVGTSLYGVSPYVATAGMASLVMLGRWMGPEKSSIWPPSHVRTPAVWLLLYAAVAVIGSFVLPVVFAGHAVQPPLDPNGYMLESLPSLSWGISNLAQAANLCIHLTSAFFIWQSIGRSDWSAHKTLASFSLASVIALLAGLHERLALVMEWPRMAAFWMSNAGYVLVESLELAFYIPYRAPTPDGSTHAVIHRISAPFAEPSYGSAFFASAYAGLLAIFLFAPAARKYALIGLLFFGVGLLNTTGATGWVAGLGATVVLGIRCFLTHLRQHPDTSEHRPRARRVLLLSLVVASAGISVLWHLPPVRVLPAVADTFFFNKFANLQNDVRYLSDMRAIDLAYQTNGLGVGMGSTRTSSFLTSLLSTTGVAGAVAFLAMLFTLIARFLRADRLNSGQYFAVAALCTCSAAVAMAIPDLNLPYFWAFIFLAFALSPQRGTERSLFSDNT